MKLTYEQGKARKQEFKTVLMPAIASELAAVLCGNIECDWAEQIKIVGSELGLYFRYDEYKHRIEVSGSWPRSRLPGEMSRAFTPREYLRDADFQAAPSSITVSADKSAQQIAADIKRRFMPAYRATFAKLVEARDRHEAFTNSTNDFSAKLAGVLGTRTRGSRNADDTLQDRVKIPDYLGYRDVEVRSESVQFTVEVSREKALKLAEILKTL